MQSDLDEALRKIDAGEIRDGKTIILLQHAERIGLENLGSGKP